MSNLHRQNPQHTRPGQTNASQPKQVQNIHGSHKPNLAAPPPFGQPPRRVPTSQSQLSRRGPAPPLIASNPTAPPKLLVSALKSNHRQVQHDTPGHRHDGPTARASPTAQSTVGFATTANNAGSSKWGPSIGDSGLSTGAPKKDGGIKPGVRQVKKETGSSFAVKQELLLREEEAETSEARVYTAGDGEARQDQRAARSQPSAEHAAFIKSITNARLPEPRLPKSATSKPVPRAGEEDRARRRKIAEATVAAEEEQWSDEQESSDYSGPCHTQENVQHTSQSMPTRPFRDDGEQPDLILKGSRGDRQGDRQNLQRYQDQLDKNQITTSRGREDRHATSTQRYEKAPKTEVDMEGVGSDFAPSPQPRLKKSAPSVRSRVVTEEEFEAGCQRYKDEKQVKQDTILQSRDDLQPPKKIKRKIVDVPVRTSGKGSFKQEEEESDSETELGNADFIKATILPQKGARPAARKVEAEPSREEVEGMSEWAQKEAANLWTDDNDDDDELDGEEGQERQQVEEEVDELETSEDDDIPPGPKQTPEEYMAIEAAKVPVAERGVCWRPWSKFGWVVANPRGMFPKGGIYGGVVAKALAGVKAPKRGTEEISSGEEGGRGAEAGYGKKADEGDMEHQVKKRRAASLAPAREMGTPSVKVKLEAMAEPSHDIGWSSRQLSPGDDDDQYFQDADNSIFEALMIGPFGLID